MHKSNLSWRLSNRFDFVCMKVVSHDAPTPKHRVSKIGGESLDGVRDPFPG